MQQQFDFHAAVFPNNNFYNGSFSLIQNIFFMSDRFSKNSSNPLIQLVKSILNKFLQAPDVYPIRYYKKGKRFRRF
jgi:hypothetical protein